MSHSIDQLNELLASENKPEERPVAELIQNYIEQTYDTQVYKCLFQFNEASEIHFIHIYLLTTAGLRKIVMPPGLNIWKNSFSEDGVQISHILKQNGYTVFQAVQEGHGILYESFEEMALAACYASSFEEFKAFREQHFNSDTMKQIYAMALFVEYKTKELMDQARANGEQQRLRNAYYTFMEKYDTYNLIKPDKHLLVHFDYEGQASHGRELTDLYWTMIQQP